MTPHRSPLRATPAAVARSGGVVLASLGVAVVALVVWSQRPWTPASAVAQAAAIGAATSPTTRPAATGPAQTQPRPIPLPEQLGLTAAQAKWGDRLPTGRGMVIGHVEGNTGEYLPELNAPNLAGVKLVPQSGSSKTFGHANATSRIIYGSAGLAPGVPQANFFAANHWLTTGCINVGQARPPQAGGIRLFTHSWIGKQSTASEEVLRRVDYLSDHDGVLMVVGVNNGAQTPVPPLLGSAYNVIAVGHLTGASSGGYTRIDGVGRCKPDLVAPGGLTSFSTPVVTSMVARLLETAQGMKATPQAQRPEVIRAILMTGAEKSARWKPEPGKPLDEHLGAGAVRFDRSYHLLLSGPQGSSRPITRQGWDYLSLRSGQRAGYNLTTRAATPQAVLTLTWNRRIDGRILPHGLTGQPNWSDQPRLARLELTLLAVDAAGEHVLARSDSAVDNVQHIFLRDLPAGNYRIEILRRDMLAEDWTAALAWRFDAVTP